jgi:hypothetical protein
LFVQQICQASCELLPDQNLIRHVAINMQLSEIAPATRLSAMIASAAGVKRRAIDVARVVTSSNAFKLCDLF